jgi:hypothetical protein
MSFNKKTLFCYLTLFTFVFCLNPLFPADVEVPEKVKPGDLFVIRITTDSKTDKKVLLRSEKGKLQFMGAVQGTPDIQMRSESLVEIEPDSELPQCYELKYLALGKNGETQFSIADSSGQKDLKIELSSEKESRNYSWLILAGGLILLIAGIKLWRYQKSSPSMMSTKSLFMNYEELEKARKMYFGDDNKTGEISGATAAPETKESSEIHSKKPEQPEQHVQPEQYVQSEKTDLADKTLAAKVTPFEDQNEEPEAIRPEAELSEETVKDMPVYKPEEPESESQDTAQMDVANSTMKLDMQDQKDQQDQQDQQAEKPDDKTEETEVVKTQKIETTSDKTAQRPGVQPPKAAPTKNKGKTALSGTIKIELKADDGRTFSGEGSEVKVGRRRTNQLILTGSEISREHLLFFVKDKKIMVKALTQSNITRLGGKDLQGEAQVAAGAALNLGGTEFHVTTAELK